MSTGRSKRRGSASAGDVARSLVGRMDTAGALDRARAVQAWRTVAGAEVSRHAMGFAMRRGELIVYTDSAAWAGELSALSDRYRGEINAVLGQDLVSGVRFSASKRFSESQTWESIDRPADSVDGKDSPLRVTAIPATREEVAHVEAMASGIHIPELREAAVRAAVKGLELRKGRAAAAARSGAPLEGENGVPLDAEDG